MALCYGIARHLIHNKGIDLPFIEQHTTGFSAYAEAADEWTPQRVENTTGIPNDAVAKLADRLMARRPAAFMIGFGLQKSKQGAEAARAVSLLPALLGQHRGFHYGNGTGAAIDWSTINGNGLTATSGRKVSQVEIGRCMAAGEFKLIYVMGSNPAMTLPDQNNVRRGLDREDVFVVVHDTHWSETAGRADVVLPAPTFLEKRDLTIPDHQPHCRLAEKAVEPLGESRHEIEVMRQLARRLGLTDAWLYDDPWTALERALAQTYQSGRLADVLAGTAVQVKQKPKKCYQTPTATIEFAATAATDGTAPLPEQQPLPPHGDAFVLLNSATAKYTHSQFTDVYGPIPQVVWVHPEDAARLGIADDDPVALYNNLAEVALRASVTAKVPIGSLWTPRPLVGINGVPLNALVPGTAQAIGGGPIFNSTRVNIRRVDRSD